MYIVIHLHFFHLYEINAINTQNFDSYQKIPIRCITVLLTGQQFIDILPTIELLNDGLIFIGHKAITGKRVWLKYCRLGVKKNKQSINQYNKFFTFFFPVTLTRK